MRLSQLFLIISLFFAINTPVFADSQPTCFSKNHTCPQITATLPDSAQLDVSKYDVQTPDYQVRNFSFKGQDALTGDKIQLIDAAYSLRPGYYSSNLQQFIKISQKTLKKNCPDLTWKTLSLTKNTVVFEYQIKQCVPYGTEYQLSKVIAGKTYFHQINYIVHGVPSSADKQKYLAVLKTAVVK